MNNKTYFDDSYPVIITPRLLESNDEWISNLFRREFCRHQPDLYEWKWIEGDSMEIRQGEEDDFFDSGFSFIFELANFVFGVFLLDLSSGSGMMQTVLSLASEQRVSRCWSIAILR